MMMNILLVAIGGSLGAVARYLISLMTAARFGADFPYGTLIANVIGCFIIGLFMTLASERFGIDPRWRLFITTGFLGGLTTFSSYSYESLALFQGYEFLFAGLNITLNLIIGFAVCWLGIIIARAI